MSESTSPTTLDWTQSDAFKTPMEICWQFDHEISQEKLENLYRKAKQAQWDAEQQLDWSIDSCSGRWNPRRTRAGAHHVAKSCVP